MTEFESLTAVLHWAQYLRRKRKEYEACSWSVVTGDDLATAKREVVGACEALDTALDRHEKEFGK